MTYAPQGKPAPVVEPGDFVFAAAHLDHGHINGMCGGLLEAGATLRWVYDPDTAKVRSLSRTLPRGARRAQFGRDSGRPRSPVWWPPPPYPTSAGRWGLRVMSSGQRLLYG